MQGASKKARRDALASLRTGLPHESLANITAAVLKLPPSSLEELRHASQRTLRKDFGAINTSQMMDLTDEIFLPEPLRIVAAEKMLQRQLQDSGFRRCMQQQDRRSPWHIVVYVDEITPGNPLKPDNKRKLSVAYWSFLELKQHLRHEAYWMPLACLRYHLVSKLQGGMSEFFVGLLQRSLEPFTAGVVVKIDDEPELLFASLANVLGDEAALKAVWGAKGASGMKPCMLCKNLVMKGNEVASSATEDYLVTITCSEVSRFDRCSDNDIWQLVDYMAAQEGVRSRASFDDLQKCAGIRHLPTGLLLNVPLRQMVRPTMTTYDSMHCYFGHGVAALELHLFLDTCKKAIGLTFKDLRGFLAADWQWPKFKRHGAGGLAAVFSDARENCTHEAFKGMASEVLMVFPLIRHLAEVIVRQVVDS